MIFIYGAYGYTGRKLVDLLSDKDVELIVAGRNPEKIGRLVESIKAKGKKVRHYVVGPDQIEDLDIPEVRLVINTAGPFSEFGESIVRFALRNNANYIDCSGEPLWVKKLYDEYSWRFAQKNLFLSSGVAWETVAGELVLKKLLNSIDVSSLGLNHKIYIVYLGEFNMSPGTLQSSLYIIKNGAWRWMQGKMIQVKVGSVYFEFDFKGRKFGATNITTADIINLMLLLGELKNKISLEILFAGNIRRVIIFRIALNILYYVLKSNFAFSLLKRILDKFSEPSESDRILASSIAFLLDDLSGKILKFQFIDSAKPYLVTAKILSYAVDKFIDGQVKGVGYTSPTLLFDFPEYILYP